LCEHAAEPTIWLLDQASLKKPELRRDFVPVTQGGKAMLVLSRRLGEEIVIDGHIRIVVVEVRGIRVRLGICAPPLVSVDRKEVHERRMVEWATQSCKAD
jgi:carbon storage regulator